MKYLRTLLCLSIVAFSATVSVALADDVTDSVLPEMGTIAISKSTESTAKVILDSKEAVTAPIRFGDGADWDNVKHSYTVNEEYVSLLKAGKICITINSDSSVTLSQSCKKK